LHSGKDKLLRKFVFIAIASPPRADACACCAASMLGGRWTDMPPGPLPAKFGGIDTVTHTNIYASLVLSNLN
jgi:hypothetical protein